MCRIASRAPLEQMPFDRVGTSPLTSMSAGVDVMALQKALGHTTLAMVSRYVHYQKDDLLEAWRRRRD